ncbi:hypothetical protein D3C84_315360 [compost metagenome]
MQVAQGLLDLALGGLGAERFGQLGGELLWRLGQQFAPLRAPHVVHSAGFGGTLLLGTGLGKQRDQGEHQHVGRQRADRREMPAAVVQHIDQVEQRDVEALQIAQHRQQHAHCPDADACQQPGDIAAAVGRRPVQYREHAGEELQGGDEGDNAQIGQILLGAEQQIEAVTGQDDGDDQRPAGPLQPAIDIAFGGWLIERQYQVVEDHAGQRQGGDDDQSAGSREAADVGDQCQGLVVDRNAQAEGEVFRVGGGTQLEACPENQGHRQAHQQQEQGQAPTGADHCPRVEVFGKGHVVHVRHDDGRGEEHQQQGAPGAFLQWRMQAGQGRLVLHQPAFQILRPIEYAIQRIDADDTDGGQLDHRLEGDGEYQAFVFLAGGDMAGAEQDGEEDDQPAVGQSHPFLHRFAGEDADGVGHRLELQSEQGQHADQHEHGGQGAGPGAAKAEGEQVGQRRQLVGAGNAQDRIEQHRRQQEGPGHPEVAGEKAVAVLIGQAHRAVEGPGTGIDAERQGVGQRVANDRTRDQPVFADPGDAEQHQQVGGTDQDQLAKAKARQHHVDSANKDTRAVTGGFRRYGSEFIGITLALRRMIKGGHQVSPPCLRVHRHHADSAKNDKGRSPGAFAGTNQSSSASC